MTLRGAAYVGVWAARSVTHCREVAAEAWLRGRPRGSWSGGYLTVVGGRAVGGAATRGADRQERAAGVGVFGQRIWARAGSSRTLSRSRSWDARASRCFAAIG
ncbi:uncharacterized protein A4U43_C03F150 [Asparagus officinalis]|uniref:Uncharacterized protein n=1 Tax=Asparagus officinalis TaxID=4686 RepID=A0A5P1F7X4_ASPOF|nr:uncharacterized protein A4U43_C03F150 [Asparagus officinalis]